LYALLRELLPALPKTLSESLYDKVGFPVILKRVAKFKI